MLHNHTGKATNLTSTELNNVLLDWSTNHTVLPLIGYFACHSNFTQGRLANVHRHDVRVKKKRKDCKYHVYRAKVFTPGLHFTM